MNAQAMVQTQKSTEANSRGVPGTHEGAHARASISLADIGREHKAREQADAQARRSLNALAVTSSLVSALIEHPGGGADHEAMVQSAREMLRCSDETSRRLVKALGAEGISWAPYRVMRTVASAVADQWRASSHLGQPSASVEHLLPVWSELCSNVLPEMEFEDPAPDSAIAMRIALLDAMRPVLHEISIFDMLHRPESAARHVRDKIIHTSQRALISLCMEPVSEKSKSLLMQALLRNAGSIYASCWRSVAEDAIEGLRGMSRAEQTSVVERNPNGLPLQGVDAAFEGSFTKLVEMLQYLSVSRDHQMSSENDTGVSVYEASYGGVHEPIASAGSAEATHPGNTRHPGEGNA